jgi:hypothetical protein
VPQFMRPLPPVLAPSCPVCFGDEAGNPHPAHLIDQRSGLQAKFGGCSLRAADHLFNSFKRIQNRECFRGVVEREVEGAASAIRFQQIDSVQGIRQPTNVS